MFTKILLLPFALATFLALPGGWLGVELDEDQPLTVKSVVKGSPAARAGIRPGDVFVAVNGRRVANADVLVRMFAGFEPRQNITLTMKRGDRELELRVTLASGRPYMGIDFDQAEGGGLHVAEVRADGPAAATGLRNGDVLTELNGQRLRSFDELDKVLADLRPGEGVTLAWRRGDSAMRKELVLGAFPDDAEGAARGERARPRRQPRPEQGRQPRRQPRPEERRQPRRQPRPQPEQQPAGDQGFSGDYQGCLAQARRSGKPVVLVFGASWCEACHTLRKSFEHPSLKEPLAGYVCIWLDTDKEGRIADRHNVQGLPHIEILDSRGKQLAKMVGHQTPEDLRAALQKGMNATAGGGALRGQSPRREERQGDRRPEGLPEPRERRPGGTPPQQLQRELERLRQQVQQLQREQAAQRRQLQEILRRLRDR